jgi:hypothetical protein
MWPASPPANDPTVIAAFLAYHTALMDKISADKTAGLEPGLATASRGVFGVDEHAFNLLAKSLDAIRARVAEVDTQRSAHVAHLMAAHLPPDDADLVAFQTRRANALVSGYLALKTTLGPQAFAALDSFVNGEFRANLHRQEFRFGKK